VFFVVFGGGCSERVGGGGGRGSEKQTFAMSYDIMFDVFRL